MLLRNNSNTTVLIGDTHSAEEAKEIIDRFLDRNEHLKTLSQSRIARILDDGGMNACVDVDNKQAFKGRHRVQISHNGSKFYG